MAEMRAMMMKIGFVLDIARKDEQFCQDLQNNTFQTLQESGIDLSPGEIMGIIDIVNGTKLSRLTKHIEEMRTKWQMIAKEC